MVENPYGLPPGLPVPEDDGACRHLPGASMPPVTLRSTHGRKVNVAQVSEGSTVFFFYPAATGKPDMPKEWDLIPGARGCTAENCAYRDHYQDFGDLGAQIFGVSAQEPEEQKKFSDRMHIRHEILSDSAFELTQSLRLPTFDFLGTRYIRRLTLVVHDGKIEKVFYPVFPPDQNPEDVLNYLRRRRIE